jgi:hypothetical protein
MGWSRRIVGSTISSARVSRRDKTARPLPPQHRVIFGNARARCGALAPLLAVVFAVAPLHGQAQNVGGRSEIFAGSDLERYLRYLQTLGLAGAYPWTIRDFGPPEIDSLVPRSAAHPWADRYDLAPRRETGRVGLDVVRPTASARFNSAFPFGGNDGPIWAGRGLTEAIQLGVRARWRAVSLTVAPIAFRAENRAFMLMPNGMSGEQAFGDRQYPTRVDRPQRFGTRPYALLDPGESALRIDTRLIALGISSAEQAWGPADTYPFILGNNAAGFPHVFAGTGMPWNLWLGHLQARLVYGKLEQTSYSSVDTGDGRRFASGLVVSLQPRGMSGLELGASRFFHMFWPDGGPTWTDLRTPIESFFKRRLTTAKTGDDNANQLASAFVRWVLPHSGMEVYGEFGREDHNWDSRDLILEPDHASAHSFGFRKAWPVSPRRMIALRGEWIEMRLNTLTRNRDIGGGYYLNSTVRQGHTERGQLLGADVTAGSGSATTLALECYTPNGRWTASWARTQIDTSGTYFRTGVRPPRVPEAAHALGFELMRFLGPVDLRTGLTAVYDFNRYFKTDAFNLNAIVGARWNGW